MATIARRDLLKGAAIGTVGLAALGIGVANASAEEPAPPDGDFFGFGAGPDEEEDEEPEGDPTYTLIAGSTYSSASWRIPPEPIDKSLITETYTVDAVVMGLGHAGATAATELFEEGYTVIGVEKQLKDSYRTTGNDFGNINSDLSESLGGGSGYDPVEFFNNWMLNTANDANPTLAMKFAQNSGTAIDWWYDKAEGKAEPRLVFEPANEERPHITTEVGPFHFYCTSVNFNDGESVLNVAETLDADGGDSKFLFGYSGVELLTDDSGAVTGIIAQNVETDEYIQINADAVILATGGFGGNKAMAKDVLLDIQYALQENDIPCFNMMGMDRTGDGIKMAYYLGARMELNPASMDGKASWQTSSPALVPMLAHPQGIHLDYTGRRFYNEYWGPIETRSRPLMSRSRKIFYAFYDDNLPEYMQYVPASHGTTNPTAETLQGVRDILDAAYAVKGTGYYDQQSQSTWYAGDTVQEVISYIGVDEKVAANMAASVESWNACVAAGADSEYGRDPEFLFPIEQGPFYIEVNEDNVVLGNFLVTLGALYTDGDQRVLGEDWLPIPNLFATGNTTGGRFGWDYFSPCYGVSVGIASTLGRECGKSVAEYLSGALV